MYQDLDEDGADGSRWVSMLMNGCMAQLGLIFFVSPARADPFIVGPIIAMYAQREDDRRALFLYMVLCAAAAPLDFVFMSSPAGWIAKLVALVALVLKGPLLYAAMKVHDGMPATRAAAARGDPAKLQAKLQETVEMVLRDVLTEQDGGAATPSHKLQCSRAQVATAHPTATLPPPPPTAPSLEDDIDTHAPTAAHAGHAASHVPRSARPPNEVASSDSWEQV